MEKLSASVTPQEPTAVVNKMKTSSEAAPQVRRVRAFSEDQLRTLRSYMADMSTRFFGVTRPHCKRLVLEFADRLRSEGATEGKPSERWLRTFLNRQVFRCPEGPSGTMPSQRQVDLFFTIIAHLKKKNQFGPDRIFHADEIFISPEELTDSDPALSEERKNVTLVCCASASGSYVPPMIVFPRSRIMPSFLRGLPSGSIGYASERGLINSDMFHTFLRHFVLHTRPTPSEPALLLVGSCQTSYVSLDSLDYCERNNVILIGFPPNSRETLQPLDMYFFRSLKASYSFACGGFKDVYPRVKMTVDNVGEVFRLAYCRSATPGNAIAGFRLSGIDPLRATPAPPDTAKRAEEDSSDVEIVSWTVGGPPEGAKGPSPADGDIFGSAPEREGIACLRCPGSFPPERWAQCPSCKQWWHAACPGGGVRCDMCISLISYISCLPAKK